VGLENASEIRDALAAHGAVWPVQLMRHCSEARQMQASGPCQVSGKLLSSDKLMRPLVWHSLESSHQVYGLCLECAVHRRVFWQRSESSELLEFWPSPADHGMSKASELACVQELDPSPTDPPTTSLKLSHNNNSYNTTL